MSAIDWWVVRFASVGDRKAFAWSKRCLGGFDDRELMGAYRAFGGNARFLEQWRGRS